MLKVALNDRTPIFFSSWVTIQTRSRTSLAPCSLTNDGRAIAPKMVIFEIFTKQIALIYFGAHQKIWSQLQTALVEITWPFARHALPRSASYYRQRNLGEFVTLGHNTCSLQHSKTSKHLQEFTSDMGRKRNNHVGKEARLVGGNLVATKGATQVLIGEEMIASDGVNFSVVMRHLLNRRVHLTGFTDQPIPSYISAIICNTKKMYGNIPGISSIYSERLRPKHVSQAWHFTTWTGPPQTYVNCEWFRSVSHKFPSSHGEHLKGNACNICCFTILRRFACVKLIKVHLLQ